MLVDSNVTIGRREMRICSGNMLANCVKKGSEPDCHHLAETPALWTCQHIFTACRLLCIEVFYGAYDLTLNIMMILQELEREVRAALAASSMASWNAPGTGPTADSDISSAADVALRSSATYESLAALQSLAVAPLA